MPTYTKNFAISLSLVAPVYRRHAEFSVVGHCGLTSATEWMSSVVVYTLSMEEVIFLPAECREAALAGI